MLWARVSLEASIPWALALLGAAVPPTHGSVEIPIRQALASLEAVEPWALGS